MQISYSPILGISSDCSYLFKYPINPETLILGDILTNLID